jgi:hypothetical protein
MRAFGVFGVLVAIGCGGPKASPPVPGQRLSGGPISVVEFTTDGARVQYDEPYDTFGLALASEIAAELRQRGHDAKVVRAGETPPPGTVVRGRILLIDGGSRAARVGVGFGAGGASFGADGEVTGSDGTRLGIFKDQRTSSGMGNMWGGSAHDLIQKCIRTVARDIAGMIDTGQYRSR